MQPETPNSPQPIRIRDARWAVGIAFGLGLAFELLFDGHVPGISIPLWVGLCVAGLLLDGPLRACPSQPARRHLAGGCDRAGSGVPLPARAAHHRANRGAGPARPDHLGRHPAAGRSASLRVGGPAAQHAGHTAAHARPHVGRAGRCLAPERARGGLAPADVLYLARLTAGAADPGRVHGAVGLRRRRLRRLRRRRAGLVEISSFWSICSLGRWWSCSRRLLPGSAGRWPTDPARSSKSPGRYARHQSRSWGTRRRWWFWC